MFARILTFLFSLVVFVAGAAAQNLIIKKFYHAERDFTANSGSTLVLDANEEPCALIKVRTNESGFWFDSGRLLPIEKTEEQTQKHPGEIYVWVQSGAKRLSLGHKQLGSIYDYDLGTHLSSGALEAGKTYILELASGKVKVDIEEMPTQQYVVFQLTPADAVVELDGQLLKTVDGTAMKLMNFGTYQYTVKAPDYQMEVGRIEVKDPENKHIIRVQLKSNFTQVTLTAPDGAEIWVNGEKKGSGQWTGNLGAGAYKFEAKKAGHCDSQRTMTLDPAAGPQTIALAAPTPIYGKADISSEPALADIYIDGQKVGQTPFLASNLLVGSHSIKITRNGYADYTSTLTVKERETVSLVATMQKQETQAAVGGGSATANAAGNQTFTVNGVTFTMVKVEAGTFTMGATSEQGSDAYDWEKSAHQVTLTKDYYIGQTEVTQALWQAVMGSNPSKSKGDNLPVEQVSWEDCQTFITKLNSLTDSKFRLPTEAEWEYAARGGNKSRGYKYSGSNSINDVAWYTSTTNVSGTKPVATKAPNELGIYDMSGNVLEWCNDWYGSYSSSPQTNPTVASSGSSRVYRGGGWYDGARSCRVSSRFSYSPDLRSNDLGLRLAQ